MDPLVEKVLWCVGLTAVSLYLDCFLYFLLTFVLSYFVCWETVQSVPVKFRQLPTDLWFSVKYIKCWFKFQLLLRRKWTLADIFLAHVHKHPNKAAFKHEDSVWTFQQVEDYSNQVSHFFKSTSLQRGDVVGIFMNTKPQYVCYWLGLTKIGVISALLNTNQKKDVLIHSLKIVNCKAVIVDTELLDAMLEVAPSIPGIKIYIAGQIKDVLSSSYINLDQALKTCPTTALTEEISKTLITDPFIYIYTSGTTGLPKAAVQTHIRLIFMVTLIPDLLQIQEDDVIYNTLPLYHVAGGLFGVGQAIIGGLTVVLRTKFSVSNFWKDCIKYECTIVQYIGEICRYLLAAPECLEEHQHKVRLIVGNGLRIQIWEQFIKRFNIKQVGEIYGATEGNASMVNFDSKLGAVGYIPWFAKQVYPVFLIKANPETNEPVRNPEGFCIQCKTEEPGICVGLIKETRGNSVFNGYVDKKETEKKILNNVFKKGDKYFNTGDILVQDQCGYYYFKDRTGDTFRWKGENVAASEVEAVISNFMGLNDVIVYGVAVPNIEGRAGMAAIVDRNGVIDFERLINGMNDKLPTYARPLFLRLIKDVPLTGTFKLKKTELQKEGFNPYKISDPLYYFDTSKNQFVPMTKDSVYQQIISGKLRL